MVIEEIVAKRELHEMEIVDDENGNKTFEFCDNFNDGVGFDNEFND